MLILFVILFLLFFARIVLSTASTRELIRQCYQMQKWAGEYPLFSPDPAIRQECRQYGVSIGE